MKNIFLISLIGLLFSCHTEPGISDEIMSKEEMISFLIDLHIIEAKITNVKVPPDTVKVFFPQIEDSLYVKHNVTDSIYMRSYQYYLEHVDEMEEIYTAVVDSLSLRERMIDN